MSPRLRRSGTRPLFIFGIIIHMTKRTSWALIFISITASILGLSLLFNYTAPETIGPLGILLTFIVIYTLCFTVIFATWKALYNLHKFFRPSKTTITGKTNFLRNRIGYISAVLAFMPLFLISLNSIGQLQIRDVFLIILIEVLAIFYIVKRT